MKTAAQSSSSHPSKKQFLIKKTRNVTNKRIISYSQNIQNNSQSRGTQPQTQKHFDFIGSKTYPNFKILLPHINYFPDYMPKVTATNWFLSSPSLLSFSQSKNPTELREVASLTKIMTSYLSFQLMTHLQIPLETEISIPTFCTWSVGTSAGLLPNETVSLKDLFHGLMLPSGNDAALALAWFFGEKLLIEEAGQHKNKSQEVKLTTGWKKVTRFVKEMNKTANKLLLKNTQFTNPNGLGDKSNRSTAEDINKLATISIQIPFIKELVGTKMYTTILKREDEERSVTWMNTNLLLDTDGFIGMKTGVTPTAGPCLTVVYVKDEIEIVLTLLNSKNLDYRWEEAKRLISWGIQKIQTLNLKKQKMNCNVGRFRMNLAYLQNEVLNK